jgi:hypothetical protein
MMGRLWEFVKKHLYEILSLVLSVFGIAWIINLIGETIEMAIDYPIPLAACMVAAFFIGLVFSFIFRELNLSLTLIAAIAASAISVFLVIKYRVNPWYMVACLWVGIFCLIALVGVLIGAWRNDKKAAREKKKQEAEAVLKAELKKEENRRATEEQMITAFKHSDMKIQKIIYRTHTEDHYKIEGCSLKYSPTKDWGQEKLFIDYTVVDSGLKPELMPLAKQLFDERKELFNPVIESLKADEQRKIEEEKRRKRQQNTIHRLGD